MTKVVIGSRTVETQADVAENWGTARLVEDAVRHGEGLLAKDGLLVVATGKHTGRSARDKRSEEHKSELQSPMRISYDVFCLNYKTRLCTTFLLRINILFDSFILPHY